MRVIDWAEVYSFCGRITPGKVYGVPRGGRVLVGIAHALNRGIIPVTSPEEADYILDDIIDSGATKRAHAKYDVPFIAMVDKVGDEMDKSDEWVTFPWEADDPLKDNADTVIRQLELIGEDPNRPGLKDTPKRYLKALMEMTSGTNEDPAAMLGTVFDAEGFGELVTVSDIEFSSLCEHHMLPFSGSVHFAYIPKGKIVGLSKIPRLVRTFSRRLQVQERMTKQIADTFEKVLEPLAVAVVVQGKHSCMSNRGVECLHGRMGTSVVRGIFKTDASARSEAFRMMGVG